jgi:hypothetical protein
MNNNENKINENEIKKELKDDNEKNNKRKFDEIDKAKKKKMVIIIGYLGKIIIIIK